MAEQTAEPGAKPAAPRPTWGALIGLGWLLSSLLRPSRRAVAAGTAVGEPVVTVATPPPMVAMPAQAGWGGILAGGLVALAALATFGALGLGVVLSSTAEGGTPGWIGSPTLALLGGGLALLVALFLGGWIAGRWGGPRRRRDAALQGLVVWALLVVLGVAVLSLAAWRTAGQAAQIAADTVDAAERLAVGLASTAPELATAGLTLPGAALPVDAARSGAEALARQAATRPAETADQLEAAIEGLRQVVTEAPPTAPTAVRPGLTGPLPDEATILELIIQQTGAPPERAVEGLEDWRPSPRPGLQERVAGAFRTAAADLRWEAERRLRWAAERAGSLLLLAAAGLVASALAAALGGALAGMPASRVWPAPPS